MFSTPLSAALRERSRLALGCSSFGGDHWGPQHDRDSLAAIEAAVDAGASHLDTAAIYGSGRSESLVGRYLKARPAVRERLLVASKGGIKGSRANFAGEIEKSRRRLNCETIDIYYIHWPRQRVDPRPSLEALTDARERGHIRYLGLSNFSPAAIAAAHREFRVDVCQFGYNLLWRSPEQELIPLCGELGIVRVAYGGLAQGLLAGRIGPDTPFPPGDDRNRTRFFAQERQHEVFQGIEDLKAAAEGRGFSLLEAVRSWCVSRTGVEQFLIGARNRRQAEMNFKPPRLDTELTQTLDRIGSRVAAPFLNEDNFFGYSG